jgi:hypothetical protein
MPKDNDMGIYLFSDKTFYYLEAGNNYIGNTLDRVRKTLIQRNLIPGLLDNPSKPAYEIMSCKDAARKDLNMKPIFISKHVENLFNSKQEKKGSFK